jgi:glycosyltransferase involved in cell wall biosynthesis
LHRLETWLDRAAPIVFTSSTQAKCLLENEFGCLPERIRVLPDCVNAGVFQPAAHYDPDRLAALRQSLGIPADRKIIVYLGLLAEYQGTGLLLEALQQIVSRRRDVHLLLMGFPNVSSYRSKAEALGISDFVTFTGRLPYEEAPVYLALGDAAVAPKLSLTEGAGKLLNYMSVGLPTVAFDTPVARQYLGPNGIFADRGNVASLVEQLVFSLFAPGDTPNSPQQRGRRLRHRARQYFGWDTAGDEIVKAYRELLGDAPAQANRHPMWATSPDPD